MHKQKVIAVDFDGTLCTNAWPEIGAANRRLIKRIIRRQAAGDAFILWTCREGMLLLDAITWCRRHGLTFDAVNESLPSWVIRFDGDPRKVGADEYWDDKARTVKARRARRKA